MTTRSTQHDPTPGRPPAGDRSRRLTVPNVLTIARLAGCGVMLWFAHTGSPRVFIALFLVFVLTDWLDGKLAVLLDQRSELGARLDSIADSVLYTVLLIGTAWLEPAFMHEHVVLLAVMIGSYATTVLVAVARFRRLPAYHTRAAKTCWLLASIGAITLLAGGPEWPALVAMVAVVITNIETVVMSFVLSTWQADVPSVFHAVRRTRHG